MGTAAFLLRAVRRRPVTTAMGAAALVSLSAYRSYGSERSSKLASDQEQGKRSPKLASWFKPFRVTEVEGGGSAIQGNEPSRPWFKTTIFIRGHGSSHTTGNIGGGSISLDSGTEALGNGSTDFGEKSKIFGLDCYIKHHGRFSLPTPELNLLFCLLLVSIQRLCADLITLPLIVINALLTPILLILGSMVGTLAPLGAILAQILMVLAPAAALMAALALAVLMPVLAPAPRAVLLKIMAGAILMVSLALAIALLKASQAPTVKTEGSRSSSSYGCSEGVDGSDS
ncbi:uncharacterized protein LOC133745943 [Rosa rugosa]|uniref:uncharacterized protein LOC133745943 n=1 Tax=Rosa rugosa TaxID=74645 RepID=UPI002B40DADA|nr:uncharacterized protein LOC133745943 [Rosa rugosa]